MTETIAYPDIHLHISGTWRAGRDARRQTVLDPATGEVVIDYPLASADDLAEAVASTQRGFTQWRRVSAVERSAVLRRAADLLRTRADLIAAHMSREQGKRLSEARLEAVSGAEVIEWFAEEARRTYGRVIPSRTEDLQQVVVKEPVGPVAAFTPWNFPVNQAVRKMAAALAAGCSIVIKGPEETPASVMHLVRVFLDAGVPPDAINLLYGVPDEVSRYLIAHPAIRKVSFTGSTVVGKQLAGLAGQHMKRATMELGGHAPVIVCDDADIDVAVKLLAVQKFWNAGQACISPSRFLVQRGVYEAFCERFAGAARGLKMGPGHDKATRMGPMANPRRVAAMEALVADGVAHGASLLAGGKRPEGAGFFFEPTVLAGVAPHARLWNEEPFGPIASIVPFDDIAHAIEEANRLPFALAAYAFCKSAKTADLLARSIETGMLAINTISLGLPEMPFGGIKDSGHGSEGGAEALESYLSTKLVAQVHR